MSNLPPSHWRVFRRTDPKLLNHLCRLRGFSADSLAPDYSLHLHDPLLLPDMEIACDLIVEAVAKKWHVTIFGDYDADGTPAAALLSLALSQLGLEHAVVLPTRESGYGLRLGQVEEIAKRSQLLITVDTGISSIDEISRAKELGVKVIVLDHHLPPATLPPADAVVDPHRSDSLYPFKHLCGCALAYKFIVALGRTFPTLSERFSKWLLDLVAISTVADMMPLVGENRALVHYGLLVLRQNRRPGLKALMARAGLDPKTLSAGTLGFVIGPRLNAAGRLGDNAPALDLLRAADQDAEDYANTIEAANSERQTLVGQIMADAAQQLFQQNNQDDRVYILSAQDWRPGVVGLVAGKLATEHARPVLVASIENDIVRGSARSIEAYPIVTALERNAELLKSFGGHATAAGFSLTLKDWPKFTKQLKLDAKEHLEATQLRRTHLIDVEVEPGDVTHRTILDLERLQPHGFGNTRPLFLVRGAKLLNPRRIGRENQHVKTLIATPSLELDSVAFGMADKLLTGNSALLDLIGYLEINRWRNQETIQFQVIDYQFGNATVEWIDHG